MTMRRREFIAGLGSAAAWPVAARAQQPERMRRIGVLLPAAADDAEFQARVGAFLQALALLGWTVGRNVRIDTRWATTNAAEIRRHAAELAALAPDIILANGGSTLGPLLQVTRTVPIVFATVSDPVGAGFADSLARPGGNATGFMEHEYSIGGKWLELLKQIAPSMTRVAVLRDATQGGGTSQFAAMQAVAPSLKVEVSPVNMRDPGEIERAVAAFARAPNGGLVVTTSAAAALHRNLIITLAARHRLPAVYPFHYFARGGGLISYGPDLIDQYRQAAGYVDRILKGEKPADLPVQAPTKYETVLNMKTAKALGFLQGLKETGYVEGQNVAVEYRWAQNQYDRLPALAADLVRGRVSVIVAVGTPAALAAKDATTTIPIVFGTGGDPVALGLVASLNLPGANLTGIARKVGRLLAFEDAASIKANLTVHVGNVETVAQKTPGCDGRAVDKHRRYCIASRQRRDLIACGIKRSVGADQKGTGFLLDKCRKGLRNFTGGPAIEQQHADPKNTGRGLQISRFDLGKTGISPIDQRCDHDPRQQFVQQRKAL
jgi:putative tryptophan/tyrosine transport system substrate-binding protein